MYGNIRVVRYSFVSEFDFMTFEMKRWTLCLKIAGGKIDSFKLNWMKWHEKVALKVVWKVSRSNVFQRNKQQ